jgi:hypothetical protein
MWELGARGPTCLPAMLASDPVRRAMWLMVLCIGCTTVERGRDFDIADVVFDEAFYYCRIEPMLFAKGCGAGDPAQGDAAGGCHFNVTAFRLTDYFPLLADSCQGLVHAPAPPQARNNYTVTQAQMKIDPESAPLLLYATDKAPSHPRKLFELQSPEADLIREWATKYSTQ